MGYVFTYGSTVEFYCFQGYLLSGLSKIKCTSSGTWSSRAPSCDLKVCSKLILEPYVMASSSSTSVGSVVKFQCPLGFSMVGTSAIVCLFTGQWSASVPKCTAVICPEPTVGVYSTLLLANRTYTGRMVVTCEKGHLKSWGDSIRSCLSNAKWSGRELYCKGNVHLLHPCRDPWQSLQILSMHASVM